MIFLKIEWVTEKMAQISPRRLGFERSLRGREFELKKLWVKVF
jgi:hypothetical protein